MHRRDVLRLPLLAAPGLACSTGASPAEGEASDWPIWAPSRAQLYSANALLAKRGTDIRQFGARLDGQADDSDALARALASDAPAILIPGGADRVLRVTREIRIARPVAIFGIGGKARVRVDGPPMNLFAAHAESDDPAAFLTGLRFDGLIVERPDGRRAHGKMVVGYNLRDVGITRCGATRMGLIGLHHTLQRLKRYRRALGTIQKDPAVLAGFSATGFDDLNDGLWVYDCQIDARTHMSQLARFDFTRRAAIAHNKGRFATISWWGGGGRRNEGGDLRHLRRARDIYAADNELSGGIGGVYGNNGEDVVVARNRVSMVTDIGIDFEGCRNVVAYDNIVMNAGNYCYATFFAAKNVVFRNNIAIQDGGGTAINERYGARKVGLVLGRSVFGMRSAGFGAVDDAIDVKLIGNQFRWTGADSFGVMNPSYFGRVEMRGNRFENVECGFNYRRGGTFIAAGNHFRFDRTASRPLRIIAASAATTEIRGNVIQSSVSQPAGSAAVMLYGSDWTRAMAVTDNRVEAPSDLPVVVHGTPGASSSIRVTNNRGSAVYAETPGAIALSANRDAVGKEVRARPLPPAWVRVQDKGASPDVDAASPASEGGASAD